MKVKILSATLGIPALALGLIASGDPANAALLTGPGEISLNGSVILQGELDGSGSLIGTNFDFILPVGSPDGDIDTAVLSGIGGFDSFNPSSTGSILDILVLGDTSTVPPTPIPNFITLDGGADPDTTYNLEVVGLPVFEENFDPITGTTDLFVSIQTTGNWISGSGETFNGSGSFTATFVDTTEAQLFADLATGTALDPKGFAADLEANNIQVPEPTSTAAVLLGMGLSAFSLKRKKK